MKDPMRSPKKDSKIVLAANVDELLSRVDEVAARIRCIRMHANAGDARYPGKPPRTDHRLRPTNRHHRRPGTAGAPETTRRRP